MSKTHHRRNASERKELRENQSSKPELDDNPKNASLRDKAKCWLPPDHKRFMFMIVTLATLVIGIVRFVQTGDLSVNAGFLGSRSLRRDARRN